jgi:hypothetical protein
MAHFAELDVNNTVLRVIVISDNDILDSTGNESELAGITYIESVFGKDMRWVQTSYNNNFRMRYAGIGYTYDVAKDAFIPPQPYSKWILDDKTLDWIAPNPHPGDGKDYLWNDMVGYWEPYN